MILEKYPYITKVIKNNMDEHSSSGMIKLISENEKANDELVKELYELSSCLLSDKNIENRILSIIKAIRYELIF